ncbi:uncharacterized protein LOC131523571, partial [Onychostoma macrolepis]|uniref:uncharacterized protein LOC131523571 n=1 Tax=Onychostoma macrolepis TaxID=369639 RepID=UPI00272AC338
ICKSPQPSEQPIRNTVGHNKSKNHQETDYFKMALKAEPERKEWHKGLAKAMSKGYRKSEFTPELNAEILEQLKKAIVIGPNDLFFIIKYALYILKKSEVQAKNNDEEIQILLERTIEIKNLEGLPGIFQYYRKYSTKRGFQEGERVRENFPTSTKVLRIVANLYKWKVFLMKDDSEERETLARKSIELLEEVVRHYPDRLQVKLSLASLHCYAHNTEKAEEIFKQLLSKKDDLSLNGQLHLFYSYACHLHYSRQSRDSVFYYMKAAEIPEMTDRKRKSIKIVSNSAFS